MKAGSFTLSFEMHIKAAGVFVGEGYPCGVLWHYGVPVISQRRVIYDSDHSADCFTLISF